MQKLLIFDDFLVDACQTSKDDQLNKKYYTIYSEF